MAARWRPWPSRVRRSSRSAGARSGRRRQLVRRPARPPHRSGPPPFPGCSPFATRGWNRDRTAPGNGSWRSPTPGTVPATSTVCSVRVPFPRRVFNARDAANSGTGIELARNTPVVFGPSGTLENFTAPTGGPVSVSPFADTGLVHPGVEPAARAAATPRPRLRRRAGPFRSSGFGTAMRSAQSGAAVPRVRYTSLARIAYAIVTTIATSHSASVRGARATATDESPVPASVGRGGGESRSSTAIA